MTTNDKRPPKTTKPAKTARTAMGSVEGAGTARHTQSAYSASSAGAPAAASAAGATHVPNPAASANAAMAAGSAKAAGPAKTTRQAKPRNDGASPPSPQIGESPAIKPINVSVTPRYREDRHASISKAAYFRSESRGFAPGHEVEDWLAAEEEVDQRLLGEGRAS